MQKEQTILLVEDEEKLAELLAEYLEASQFKVIMQHDGGDVVERIKKDPPDLILLDLMLPKKDGIEICKEIRKFSDIPIVMVTAKVEEIDRLLGLELGADDYICKPYSPREVVARVKAVLRRSSLSSREDGSLTDTTPLQLDEDKYCAILQNVPLDLTPVEFRLLKTLADSPGRVFSRDQLIDKIYSDHRIVTDRTVDTHIKNLRKKMEEVDSEAELIHSVYGVGYKFESPW